MQERSLLVSFRGRDLQVEVSDSTSFAKLGHQLEQAAHVQPETIKLLLTGQKGGPIRLLERDADLICTAGLKPGMKVMMVASSKEQVQAVQQSRDLPGMAGFDHELRQAARRRRGAGSLLTLPTGQNTFQGFEAWQRQHLHPAPAEALKLLQRLAADPGIAGIMQKHRWGVGLLSEMPPEGKVGVSPMCILGVNINRGQEISLRLRTDDLQGFRRYDRIRETLCHELAHMVWGDHDNNFKALNSQLLKECAQLDWTSNEHAHTLAATSAADSAMEDAPMDPSDIMASSAASSGKTLRQLAAESPPAESAYQQPLSAPADGLRRQSLRPAGAQTEAADDRTVGIDGTGIEGLNHRHDSTEAAEAAARSLGADSVQSAAELATQIQAQHTHEDADKSEAQQSSQPDTEMPQAVNQHPKAGDQHTETAVQSAQPDQHMRDSQDDAVHSPSAADGSHSLSDAEPASRETSAAANSPEDSRAGAVPQNLQHDTLQADPSAAAAAAAAESRRHHHKARNDDAAMFAGDADLAARYQRAQQAVRGLVSRAGPEQASTALHTLATIIQNAMKQPQEQRFRRVRTHNSAFQQRAGRFQQAIDVLHVAGFVLEYQTGSQEATLALKRDDPGLLWLALSAVNSALPSTEPSPARAAA